MNTVESIAITEKLNKNETLVSTTSSEISLAKSEMTKNSEKLNEDRIKKINENTFAVCDGMGGTKNGSLASETAIKYIDIELKDFSSNLELTEGGELPLEKIKERFEGVISESQEKIVQASKEQSLESVPGTTATIATICRNKKGEKFLISATVGDSPVLLYKKDSGTIEQVNAPGSYYLNKEYGEDENKKRGAWERIQSAKRPEDLSDVDNFILKKANVISQSLGGSKAEKPKVSFDIAKVEEGDRVLIGSDGIEGLSRDEIRSVLEKKPKNEDAALDMLKRIKYRNIYQKDSLRRHPDDTSLMIIDIENGEKRRVETSEKPDETDVLENELMKKIEQMGTIKGTNRDYNTEFLQERAKLIINGEASFKNITRENGLREMLKDFVTTKKNHLNFAKRLSESVGWINTSGGKIFSPEDTEVLVTHILRNNLRSDLLPRMKGLRESVENYTETYKN